MSLNIFLMLCILAIDFMIYAFFQWVYGDKRGAVARQVAACRRALSEEGARPFVVASGGELKAARNAGGGELAVKGSKKSRLHASYRRRIA